MRSILPVSAYDTGFIGVPPIGTVFFYPRNLDPAGFESSFRRALDHFETFQSRLAVLDDGSFGLYRDRQSGTFQVLEKINRSIDDFSPRELATLVPLVETIPGSELIRSILIPLDDGCVLANSVSHLVSDGLSFYRFMQVWSSLQEGSGYEPPSSQRSFSHGCILREVDDGLHLPRLYADRLRYHQTVPRHHHVVRLSANDVAAIVKDSSNGDTTARELQILTAHLLKRFAAKLLPTAASVRLRTNVDIRYIHSQVDVGYVGNAFIDAVADFTWDSLDRLSLSQLAAVVQGGIDELRVPTRVERLATMHAHGLELPVETDGFDPERDLVCTNVVRMGSGSGVGFGQCDPEMVYPVPLVPNGFVIASGIGDAGGIVIQIVSRFPLDV